MDGGQQSETDALFALVATNLQRIGKTSTEAGCLSG